MSGICYTITNRPHPEVQPSHPNAASVGSQPRIAAAVVTTSALWKKGQIIRVRFANGTDQQKLSVANWAGEWSKYANLFFAFGSTDDDAEIVTKFGEVGNWSAVGTQSVKRDTDYFRQHGCTLAIQDMFQGTVQHEFGHAIGMEHEHESPAGGIQWNKEVIYRELGGDPNYWDRDTVDWNMFYAYDKELTQFSAVDTKSVMMYEIPARWTLNGFSTARQNGLSEVDKTFISAIYPGATVRFDKPDIRVAHCAVTWGAGTMYNQYYGNSWIMNYPGTSFIEVNFNQPKTFGGKNIYEQAKLKLTHLSSSGGKGYQSPINIVVNGTKVKTNYSPPSDNWLEDDFDVTAKMKDGDNKIRLEFQKGAQMNYWINKLEVICSGGERMKFN